MFKRIIAQSALWLIIIGTISWAITYLTGGNMIPTFIKVVNINYGNTTQTMYQLDVTAYLKQVESLINIPWQNMYGEFPTTPKFDNTDVLALVKTAVNYLILIINVMIWVINIIVLIPTKLLLQPILLLFTLLGIDITNNNLVKDVYSLYTVYIPPIPYWQ